MARNEKGFSAAHVILAVAVVALIGLGGWFVWHQNQADKDKKETTKILSQVFSCSLMDKIMGQLTE